MEGQFLKEELRGITSNAEEAGVEWSYEDLQNLLELTPKTVQLGAASSTAETADETTAMGVITTL